MSVLAVNCRDFLQFAAASQTDLLIVSNMSDIISKSRSMDEGTAPPRKRRRPALSCVQCRRRKIKCNRNTPSCGQCTQSKSSATCSYSPDDTPAPVNRCPIEAANLSTTSSTTTRFGSLGLTSNSHSPILSFSGSSASHILPSSSLGAVSEVSLPGRHSEPITQEPRDQAHQLQQLSDAVSRFPNNAANVLVFPETAPNMRGSLSKTRFFGQNHWTASLEQVKALPVSNSLNYMADVES
jgi:hypothetical protein